ncbi:MAG: 4-(cytidine 5'-diphospho)-2-C-methyl-D-erythritol kinase [Lachnospiraceae bacterium]
MKQIKLKAYAKINLGLDVLRKREDGYHEVRMIMQTIRLFDRIIMTKTRKNDIYLETNLSFLPTDERNLVYRAVKMIKEEFHIQEGVRIELNKKIPVCAGMAGGSTDAAAALVGMNKLFQLKLSEKQLMEYGLRLGADVPYCIMRGTALSEGIGEKLSRVAPIPNCYILIAKPNVNVSTKFVYENLNLPGLTSHPDIDLLLRALEEGDLYTLASNFGNVLETVTVERYPVIQQIKQSMVAKGALGALMSGSGPTVFGIFDSEAKAKEAYREVRKIQSVRNVYITEPFQVRK